jgi:hypothetical protein
MSDVPTIGDIGAFGGSPCIFISLDKERTAILNADTKRTAVEQYVQDAQLCGAEATWSVIPSRRGRLNKLHFTTTAPKRLVGIATFSRYPHSRRAAGGGKDDAELKASLESRGTVR